MPSVTLTEAQAQLPELIEKLIPGEELRIVADDHIIARLVRTAWPPLQEPRQPGSAIGILKIIEEDDSHLEDFKEYM